MGFFGSLLGTDTSALKSSYKKAQSQLSTGYNTQQDYYQQAADNYSPYTTAGTNALTAYSDLLGLNGTDAQSTAESNLENSSLWTGKLAQDSNAALKYLNARGLNASGTAALAGQRVLYDNYNDILNQYSSLANTGLTATTNQSGVYTGMGNNAYQYGTDSANNSTAYGSAVQQAKQNGVNNVLGLLGTGVNALSSIYGTKK